MGTTITGEEAVRLLEVVVAAKGEDFVYERIPAFGGILVCVNFNEGRPSCIVGHVLNALGLNAELASTLRVDGNSSAFDTTLTLNRLPSFGYVFSPEAMDVLIVAQHAQDAGETWGEALRLAKRELADPSLLRDPEEF